MSMVKLRREVEKLGGTVYDRTIRNHIWSFLIDSPDEKVWNANGCHVLVIEQRWGPKQWLNDAVADALERVALGVSECDDPECDHCHP